MQERFHTHIEVCTVGNKDLCGVQGRETSVRLRKISQNRFWQGLCKGTSLTRYRAGLTSSKQAAPYSFNDTGSDRFFGDCLFSSDTSSRPDAGTPTFPSRTICLAFSSRPYNLWLALPSE